MPHEGTHILLLLGMDTGDGAVRAVPAAGDEGDPDRSGGGEAVEAASGVEELLQRRWPLRDGLSCHGVVDFFLSFFLHAFFCFAPLFFTPNFVVVFMEFW